jgi:hypothetical protein
VEAGEVELRRSAADVPWKRAQRLEEGAPEWVRWVLPEIALALAADHPGVAAWVRGKLPPGMPAPAAVAVKDWLAFVRSQQQRPMRVVADGDPEFGYELDALAKGRTSWRADLLAVATDRMCVLAPPAALGTAACCLATGELVLDALEGMFAGIGDRSAGERRLLVKLYATRDEYLQVVAQELVALDRVRGAEPTEGGGAGAERSSPADAEAVLGHKRMLGMTLGIYTEAERLTRLFVPPGKEGRDSALATFAHELTHQWLAERGPRFPPPANPAPLFARPGHWIVEGFASFVESFVWDTESRRWDTWSRSQDIEMFAAADADQLNKWSTQLTVSQVNMHRRMSKQPRMFIRHPDYLGGGGASAWNMFYWQGAAVCQYLYHAGAGQRRRALLEYVVNYYSGQLDALGIERAFGVDPGELGRLVTEYVGQRQR